MIDIKKKYKTVSGSDVTNLRNGDNKQYPIVGEVNCGLEGKEEHRWTKEGRYWSENSTSHLDLIEVGKPFIDLRIGKKYTCEGCPVENLHFVTGSPLPLHGTIVRSNGCLPQTCCWTIKGERWDNSGSFYNLTEVKEVKAMISMDKKYKTEDGSEVRIYATDGKKPYLVQGAVKVCGQWEVQRWTKEGCFFNSTEPNKFDLVEIKSRIQRTCWVCVYPETDRFGISSDEFSPTHMPGAIARVEVKIDCEEGEGL